MIFLEPRDRYFWKFSVKFSSYSVVRHDPNLTPAWHRNIPCWPRAKVKDRSIFEGVRDRKICSGTVGYFTASLRRGQRIFCQLSTRDHRLFLVHFSNKANKATDVFSMLWTTGPLIIFIIFAIITYRLWDHDKFFSGLDTGKPFFAKYISNFSEIWHGATSLFSRLFQAGHDKLL